MCDIDPSNTELISKNSENEATFIREGSLNFVDLAGCERLLYDYKVKGNFGGRRNSGKGGFSAKTEKNLRLKESKAINKSLFFLTQVIFMASKGSVLFGN